MSTGYSPESEPMEGYTEQDRVHLAAALELAELGRGLVSPGPLVGCVITNRAGEVVGRGTYFRNDLVHAEVVALREAGDAAVGGTAYISLEPHAHHGKTPPCTEALLNAGIERVVAPIEDPNPLVSGKGFEFLREKGVKVDVGLLREEASRQNEAFVVWHGKKRPFVHLKLAVSMDGKIATRTGNSQWITGPESRERVHAMRNSADAILVGSNTVIKDDPSLTDRSGRQRVRDLVRIVLDETGSVPADSKVFDGKFPSLLFSGLLKASDSNSAFEHISYKDRDLRRVLDELYEREIQSLLVEGGGEVAGSFIEQGYVDRVTLFVAPIIIGGRDSVSAVGGMGIDELSEAMRLTDVEVEKSGDDIKITAVPESR